MSRKCSSTNQPQNYTPTPKKRFRIGISITVIVITVVVLFMPKKTANDIHTLPIADVFKKQGELIFTKPDNTPIISIDIEIADNDSRREVGLMGCPTMDERHGRCSFLKKSIWDHSG